jgi:hypothetical protein
MMARTAPRTHRREDVEEFDRKLRRFHESLAHKERRMLRELITASLEQEDEDTSGFAGASDEVVLQALYNFLMRSVVEG